MFKTSLFSSVMLMGLCIPAAFAGPLGTTLSGTKTATATFTVTNTYTWALTKTPQAPDQVPYVIPIGDSATIGFTVTGTRSGPVVTNAASPVSGQVCLTNTGTASTQGLFVTDQIEQETAPGVWTAVAGPVSVPVAAELAPGETECYPYSITFAGLDPANTYRNHALVNIDNYLGFEGTSHVTDVMAPVTITTTPVDVDATATINDVFSCPAGFTCVPSWTQQLPTDTTAYPYTVLVTNDSAACGLTLTAANNASLIPSTTATPVNASSSAQIFTGTCAP